jgi:membrane associated rhomboid family serine protease
MPDTWDYTTNRPQGVEAAPPAPILTWLLCLLCVLFTLAHHTTVQRPGSLWYEMGQVGRLPADAVWSGRLEQLFLTVFVHGTPTNIPITLLHLGFNTLWLLRLGTIMESTLHPLATALFFLASAVVSAGCELAATSHLSVGASGVVYAIFGLLWAGRSRYKEWQEMATTTNFAVFVGWGVFCIFLTWMRWFNVANAAHFGGLLFGMAVGWVFVARKRPFLGGLTLAALVIVTAISVCWMPWAKDWTAWKGVTEASRGRYDQAYPWLLRSLRQGHEPTSILNAINAVYGAEVARHNPYGAAKAVELALRLQGYNYSVAPTKETLEEMRRSPQAPTVLRQPQDSTGSNPAPPSDRIR